MRRLFAALMLVASAATVHAQVTCEETFYNLETGESTPTPPENAPFMHVLNAYQLAEDGTLVFGHTLTTEGTLTDAEASILLVVRGMLCAQPELPADLTVPTCEPDKAWYGCSPEISQ